MPTNTICVSYERDAESALAFMRRPFPIVPLEPSTVHPVTIQLREGRCPDGPLQ